MTTGKTSNNLVPNHELCLKARETLTIEAVTSVESFSDKEITLITVMGKLNIKGDNLHIEKFNKDTGEFMSTGKIHSLVYSKSSAQKGSFIERLFK